MRILLVLCLFGMPYSVWAIYDGFRTGLMLIPFLKGDHHVSMSNQVAFFACVIKWLLLFAFTAFGARVTISWLTNRPAS